MKNTLKYIEKWSESVSYSVMSSFWDPMNCSPPGSIVHGILQARILEWVAIPFSRGSSQPKDWTQVLCIAGGFLTIWATRDILGSSKGVKSLVEQYHYSKKLDDYIMTSKSLTLTLIPQMILWENMTENEKKKKKLSVRLLWNVFSRQGEWSPAPPPRLCIAFPSLSHQLVHENHGMFTAPALP